MTQQPPRPYASSLPPSRDADHLNVLGICHYVWGGLLLLFGCLPLIYVFVGTLMVTSRFQLPMPPSPTSGPTPPPFNPQNIGWILVTLGLIGTISTWVVGVLNLIAARRLGRRRSRTFGLVVAGLNCVAVPVGTVLGVFTILVLSRPSVKAIYDGHPTDPPYAGPAELPYGG